MDVKRATAWHKAKRIERIGALVAIIVLLALTALLMRNWLRGGLPTSPRQETIPELTITWMFREELRQGQLLSEWNPTWFSGFPWLRFLSYPFYYVLAAVSLWGEMPLEAVMVLYYFLVMAASGMAMFGYLHRVLGDWRPALVGAMIYEAFPYHNHVGVETWIHAAVWVLVPLSLWFIELAYARPSQYLGRFSLVGIALGLFPIISSEYTIIAGPFVGLYLLARMVLAIRQGTLRVWRAIFGLVVVGVIAGGLAAFYVLPGALEVQYVGIHAKHGAESTFTNELLRDYSVTPGLVWYAIVRRLPDALRLPVSEEGLPGIVSAFWSVTWYPGIIASVGALLGLYAVWKRRACACPLAGWAAVVGLALSMLMVLGPTFAFNPISAVPVLGRLSPFRGMLLVVVWISVLAAHGLDWLMRAVRGLSKRGRRKQGRWTLPAPGTVAAWVLFIIALGLVPLDFGPSAAAYVTTDSYFTAEEQEAYAWLREHATSGRFWDVASTPREEYLRTYSLSQFPMPRYWGYYDNGAPLYTHRQVESVDLATNLGLHRVRYVLLRQGETNTPQHEATLREAGYRSAWQGQGVAVWQNAQISGYARFYPSAALDVATNDEVSLAALPRFVGQGIALVAADAAMIESGGAAGVASGQVEGAYLFTDDPTYATRLALASSSVASAQVVTPETLDAVRPIPPVEVVAYAERQGYDSIYVGVSVPESGVLTVAESWYPHWQVLVNGKARQALRVNTAFLGVWLEPGEHRIEFRFHRPWYEYVGFGATGITLLILVLWWTWYLGRILNNRYLPIPMDLEALYPPLEGEAQAGNGRQQGAVG